MKKLADLGGVPAARTEDVDSPPKLVSAYVGFGEHHKEFMIFFLLQAYESISHLIAQIERDAIFFLFKI